MHVIAGEKMNTYRIAVCDDDPVMREQLHSFCRELLDGECIPYAITAFPSAAELEKRMNSDVEKPFNLLILDIQMNGMTGLELARSLRSKDDRISIIFVTACDNYLSEGYDVQPIHFLLKPICREALANAIRTDLKLNYLPKAVTLSIGNKILHFSVSEIRYVESYNHNIIIHQSSGNSNTYYLSLTEFEKQLPKGHFSRCHNSFLVNLSRVKEIGRTDLTLRNGDMLPVGRTYYKAFQSAFIRYINQ